MPEPKSTSMENWRLYMTAVPCFFGGGMGWLRFAAALREWDFLTELGAWPGPLYMALSGALWGLLGWGAVGLLLANPRGGWNHPVVFLAVLLAVVLYWVDLLVFTRPAEMLVNWPFALVVTAAGLVYYFLLLRLPRWWRLFQEAQHGSK